MILLYLEAIQTLPTLLERALSYTKALKNNNSSNTSPGGSTSTSEHLVVSQRRARQEIEEWVTKIAEMLNQFKTLNGAAQGLLGGGLAWIDLNSLQRNDMANLSNDAAKEASSSSLLNQNDTILNGRLCVAQMTSKVVDWAEKLEIITSKKVCDIDVLKM